MFNVHRSASVYTPRTLVVINPPSTDNVARIREAGGAQRALAWILSGMVANSFEQVAVTRESFKRSLLAQKIPSKLADDIVEQAVITGAIVDDRESIALEASRLVDAEGGAVNIALALTDSRIRIQDLVTVATVGSALRQKYEVAYPHSLSRIGLEDVEFVDSFPVLTGCYGYTRGDFTPGASRLVPFRNKKGDYIIYGDIIKTEALFVRLKPQLVFEWLRRLGCTLDSSADAKSARLSILRTCSVPPPGSSIKPSTPGTHLLTLVHTIAHWFIRKLAVLAGIERNALAEFLIPQHCAFFVYAATRGDFVLGGLQAVFESELERFLNELAASDLRCPLDPGCLRVGGACVACLHLGEPSCRYFNTYLNRTVLEGESGYLSLAAEL